MTSFFMNGSELFLYPKWKTLVKQFALSGSRLALSTNGMLLRPEISDYLLQKDSLRDVNFSFDGASQSTVEAIRRGVRFRKLLGNTRHSCSRPTSSLGRCRPVFLWY